MHFADYLDLDIQEAEFAALTDAGVQQALDRRLRRVHIGTHTPKIHSLLKTHFLWKGWHLSLDIMYGMYEHGSGLPGESGMVYLEGCGVKDGSPLYLEGQPRWWGDKYVFDSLQQNPTCTQQTR